MSYIIATWDTPLSKGRLQKARAAVRRIDKQAVLVDYQEPGNDVRLWLERPDDGWNESLPARWYSRAMIAAVEEVIKDQKKHGRTND